MHRCVTLCFGFEVGGEEERREREIGERKRRKGGEVEGVGRERTVERARCKVEANFITGRVEREGIAPLRHRQKGGACAHENNTVSNLGANKVGDRYLLSTCRAR